MDGVHPQHNMRTDFGWIKSGERFEIPSNSGRQRLNLNGAVNAHEVTDVEVVESNLATCFLAVKQANILNILNSVPDINQFFQGPQKFGFLDDEIKKFPPTKPGIPVTLPPSNVAGTTWMPQVIPNNPNLVKIQGRVVSYQVMAVFIDGATSPVSPVYTFTF